MTERIQGREGGKKTVVLIMIMNLLLLFPVVIESLGVKGSLTPAAFTAVIRKFHEVFIVKSFISKCVTSRSVVPV